MEVEGVFRCGLNGVYSFKSLLLDDGEVVEEVAEGAGLPARPAIDVSPLNVGEEVLYRDEVVSGRESFKSLLLDDGMGDEEVHFSSKGHKLGNDHFPSALPTTLTSKEKEESSKDGQGSEQVEEEQEAEVVRPPPKKRKRGKNSKPAESKNMLALDVVPYKHGSSADYVESHPEPLRMLPPARKKKRQELLTSLPPPRKKKHAGTTSDVQKLLDTVIARQERFFLDLLKSMERKGDIRERLREEKENKWRAEERAQIGVFNSAMIALTKELLGDTVLHNM